MRAIVTVLLIGAMLMQMDAFAQTKSSLSGKVTDATGEHPLAGATVRIHDINRDATTDEAGVFKFNAIPAGKYLVEVSYVGHESVVENMEISGAVQHDFDLKEAVLEQEGVTVTGVTAATRLKQSAQPVSIVKKAELMKISSSNIINSLTHVPGVTALTTGPAISKPFIRGLGYNRVLVVNDGMRQEGQQWGDEHGIEIDDYSAQRIEVLKGPASLMYGSDALAGVINIQSLMPAPDGALQGNIISEYQTNSRLRGFYGSVGGSRHGFSFNAYGSYKGAQDYRNKYDGPVFNSKFYNRNFGGLIGYSGSWGHSFLRVVNFDQHIGMVEGERDDITGQFLKPTVGGDVIASDDDFDRIKPVVPYQHIRHFKISSENSFNFGGSKLDAMVGFQRNQRQEFGDPDAFDTPNAFFDLKTVNYSLKLNLPSMNNWKTSVGVSGMAQNNKNRAGETLIPDYDLFDIGGFIFTQYHHKGISLSGGLRMDTRNVDGRELYDGADLKFPSFNKNFSNLSGSVGMSYEATKELTLKLNVARGFRSPSLAELASNGAHEGTIRYEVGNLGLKSETSLQVDGGVELNTEHVTLGAGLFYNHVNKFIFYEKVLTPGGSDSLRLDPETGNELMVFRFDQRDASLYGAEFNMDIHPHPLDWLHFENTFSYTRAKFAKAIDGSRDVPNIPSARYVSQLKGNLMPKGKTLRNLYLSFESDYTFRQDSPFTGYTTETATRGYWLVGINAGTNVIRNGKTLFSVNLSGMNLGDVAYQNHLSRLKYAAVNNVTGRQGVFNVGRSYGIKLSIPIEGKWN